jgi:hypothetical protein
LIFYYANNKFILGEIHFLTFFIGSQLSPGSLNCRDFERVIRLKRDEYTILEHLYYELPGSVYPDLVGVIDDINLIKGLVSLINYS